MKFTIITPSLNRESLKRCCESIDIQSHTCWEHLVSYDGAPKPPFAIDPNGSDDRRKHLILAETHKWGNQQRRQAWYLATGNVVIFLDDDNTLAHPDALKDIADRLESAGNPAWAICPIIRHGRWFFNDPPGMCMTDTANLVIRREFGQWPDTEAREADGLLCEQLKTEHPYAAFPDCPPIIIMEHSSNGV